MTETKHLNERFNWQPSLKRMRKLKALCIANNQTMQKLMDGTVDGALDAAMGDPVLGPRMVAWMSTQKTRRAK